MSMYSRLRELGFSIKDSLARTAGYKLSGLPIDESDLPEVDVGRNLKTLENVLDPSYVPNARRPRNPSILSKTSRSHLDCLLVGLHTNYRFCPELFSDTMTQRYEQALQKVPESKKPLLDAIDAIPLTASEDEKNKYLQQIDEQYVLRRSE